MKVGIIGATAYTARELIMLLVRHPEVQIVHLGGRREGNPPISDIFTSLRGICDLPILGMMPDDAPEKPDLVFFTLPHSLSQDYVPHFLQAGIQCVDFSADYRFDDPGVYAQHYTEHRDEDNLDRSVYGIPELFRDRIASADLVGNPGCYPTSVALGLAPLADGGLIQETVTVASMSGVSGAGNKPTQASMFCECNEDIRAYKVEGHRHEPEMEHVLRMVGGADVAVTFVPHLAPMNRGILSTMVLRLSESLSTAELNDLYSRFYEGEPFVRVLPPGQQPRTRDVSLTNLCDIGLAVRQEREVIVTAAIDNLMKGAASQAVQNMNCMSEMDETLGLL